MHSGAKVCFNPLILVIEPTARFAYGTMQRIDHLHLSMPGPPERMDFYLASVSSVPYSTKATKSLPWSQHTASGVGWDNPGRQVRNAGRKLHHHLQLAGAQCNPATEPKPGIMGRICST